MDATTSASRPPRRRAREKASVAGLTSRLGADNPRVQAARRDYRALALEDHIREELEKAPPLTSMQRAKLAALLRPASTEAVSA